MRSHSLNYKINHSNIGKYHHDSQIIRLIGSLPFAIFSDRLNWVDYKYWKYSRNWFILTPGCLTNDNFKILTNATSPYSERIWLKVSDSRSSRIYKADFGHIAVKFVGPQRGMGFEGNVYFLTELWRDYHFLNL